MGFDLHAELLVAGEALRQKRPTAGVGIPPKIKPDTH